MKRQTGASFATSHGSGAIALLLAAAWSCGGSSGPAGPPPPPPPPPPPAATARVEIERVADIENFGDGRDLEVRYRQPSGTAASEQRVFVVPLPDAGSFTESAAAAAAADRFVAGATGAGPHTVAGSASLLDSNGDTLAEGVEYVVFVLSRGAGGDALAGPSSALTLARTHLVRTLTAPFDAGSGGMEVDAAGNIYAADFGPALNDGTGPRVYRITPSGQTTVWATGLIGASGNAFDSQGRLLQSNIGGRTVSRIAPDGTWAPLVTSGLQAPVGIAVTAGDAFYIADCGANAIVSATPQGQTSTLVQSGLFNCPNGIALASDGNLYVANFGDGWVLRVTPAGVVSRFVEVPGNNNGHITRANDRLYVVARGANQIYELDLDGTLTLLAGSGARGLDDGAALSATLSLTNDLAPSPDGRRLYFNDVGVTDASDTSTLSPSIVRYIELVDGS